MAVRYWVWLIVVQSVWASSYVAMKMAVAEVPVAGVVFLRYGIAALGFLILWRFTGFPRVARRDLALLILLGAGNFALTPILQLTGIQYTQATDVSILIAFEPLITVLVAAMALRELPNRQTMITFFIATIGLFILSGVNVAGGSFPWLRLFGNLLFLFGLVFEAGVSVGGRALTQRYRPDHLIGLMMMAGFLANGVVNAPTIGRLNLGAISMSVWGAVLFLGLACSIFTYVVWFRVLKVVPVNRVALSLFVQPVVGIILGGTILGETINAGTIAGAVLICVSLVAWQVREMNLAASIEFEPGSADSVVTS